MDKPIKRVVLFNGPPNSGKDYCASVLCNDLKNAKHLMFKDCLYRDTAEWFGVDYEWFKDIASNRDTKEVVSEKLVLRKPRTCTDGYRPAVMEETFLSPRQALICVSEECRKPAFGKDYYGKIAASQLIDGWNIFSDSGFDEEAQPLVDAVGVENIYIVHISRPGCSFAGDSRNYLRPIVKDDRFITTMYLQNSGNLSKLNAQLDCLLSQLRNITERKG